MEQKEASRKMIKDYEEQRKREIAAKKAAEKEEEFNNLRDMLWEEELEAKRAADARERAGKQRRMKMEMMEANNRMMVQKAEIKRVEAEKEAKLLDIMRKKFAEDERLEKEKEDLKLNAKKHHMTLVEKQ